MKEWQQIIIIRAERTNQTFKQATDPEFGDKVIRMVTSETEASKYHQIMKSAVCNSDVPEDVSLLLMREGRLQNLIRH